MVAVSLKNLNFVEDQEIDSVETVSRALVELGLDANAIIEQAQESQNKERLKEQTQRAQALGVFGGPTFFVAGEMFWGNDRLDEAIEWAARA
mgnify:FL=1